MTTSPLAAKPPPPRLVHGVSEDQYRAWKQHPVTLAQRQYLKHFAEAQRQAHLGRWESKGETPLNEMLEQEALGRIKSLEEIAGLEFHHMADFYISENEEPDADEADPNGEGDL